MTERLRTSPMIRFILVVIAVRAEAGTRVVQAETAAELRIEVVVDRGADTGQAFGSLFEIASADGSVTIGAGFANGYGTRYRADRHELAFFVRPREHVRPLRSERLPRPNDLCGTYLFSTDGAVHSTFGGLRRWDEASNSWVESRAPGGTSETMRLGRGKLTFGDSAVTYDGRTILPRPARGSYQLFFYAGGNLCFYHVDRGEGGYRPYKSDEDGFSKLYACPWTPSDETADLSKAVVMTLPVVGETTFAWGIRGNQIVTGSNIGGFYVFEDGRWRKDLDPNINVSYQLYSSMAFGENLLMGQYPTGRLFEFDGRKIVDRPGWPPVAPGVSASAREAQSTVIYGGEMFVGVWPWGELWRYRPDSATWHFERRMFEHPLVSREIVHPYDAENRNDAVPNQWGQRVTSLVPNGRDLFVATSAKDPCVWDEQRAPFLAADKWKSYGSVYRLTMPGHVSTPAAWTDGPTKFEFVIAGETMSIVQDGRLLATAIVTGEPEKKTFVPVAGSWGKGVYGSFTGVGLEGRIVRP